MKQQLQREITVETILVCAHKYVKFEILSGIGGTGGELSGIWDRLDCGDAQSALRRGQLLMDQIIKLNTVAKRRSPWLTRVPARGAAS